MLFSATYMHQPTCVMNLKIQVCVVTISVPSNRIQ